MRVKIGFLLVSILLFFSVSSVFAEIEISLSPQIIIAGEPATLTIKSDKGIAEIVNLSDIPGISWLNTKRMGSNVMVINGQRFEITTYSFIVEKPGKFTLPSFKIQYDGEEIETQPKEFTASEGYLSNIDKFAIVEPVYKVTGKVYTGQSIPLEINLLRAANLDVTPSGYPQISLDNVVFDNFSSKNKENERFAIYPYYPPEKVEKNSIPYVKTCFMTSFRSMSSGKLSGSVSIPVEISVPDTSHGRRNSAFGSSLFNSSIFDDPFFNRSKRVSRVITAELPVIDVFPLPKVPDGIYFLGLFGDWKCDISLTPEKISKGETIKLTLNLSGYGSLEELLPPQLSLPGWTIYSPEVKKDQSADIASVKSKAVITYLMIPREAGDAQLNISFSAFDTKADKYAIFKIDKTIAVTEGSSSQNKVLAKSFSEDANKTTSGASSSNQTSSYEPDSILHIKRTVSEKVRLPLLENYLWFYIALIVLGPLLFAFCELYKLSRRNLSSELIRKQNALKNRSRILKTLREKKDSELYSFIDSDVVPFINDMSGFPPGTTTHELTKKVTDALLSECLAESELMKYMKENDIIKEKAMKTKLIQRLKKLSVILLVGAALLAPLQMKASGNEDFVTAYNTGDFKKAEEIAINHISGHTSEVSPAWLYNLANTYVQNGDLGKALVYYERALLLSPRDQDILQNLNYVRRTLNLPELYKTATPFDIIISVRDSLRPDEWLLAACIAFFAIFVILTIRKKIFFYGFLSALLSFAFLIILFVGIYFSQMHSLYSSGRIAVIRKNPTVYMLPSDTSKTIKTPLHLGEELKMDDKMGDWTLISAKNGKTIGWVKSDSVCQIWPY